MVTVIKDNPNRKANIAILIPPHLFFIDAFKSILEHLPNAEYVLDFTAVVRQDTYPNFYKEVLRKRLQDDRIHWRDLEQSDREPSEFFDKYALLVAPFYAGLIAAPYNNNKKKVKVDYGTAKNSWGFGLPNAHFDLLLCPGPYAARHLSIYSGKIMPIGEPKLDGLYENRKTKEQIIGDHKLKLDLDKKTILYQPTWGTLSSLTIAVPALISISDRYNIVLKAHHVAMLYEPTEFDAIRGSSISLISDEVCIADALTLADIVISDNSSSIFDAVAAEKPLILIDTIDEKEDFYVERPFYGYLGNKLLGVGTNRESIEQMIKMSDKQIAPVLKVKYGCKAIDGADLEQALLRLDNADHRERRAVLLQELYAYRDGNAGKRAAEEICKLLIQNSARDQNLERLVDEFEHRVRTTAISNERAKREKNIQKLEWLESIKQMSYGEKMRSLVTLIREYF